MIATTARTLHLDHWLAKRLGVPGHRATREAIRQYQLRALQQTMRHARTHSRFYAQRLALLPNDLPLTLNDMCRLPFTTEQDLVRHGQDLLCISQSQVARVVTMQSSGTGGERKRIFFSTTDQELFLDFFAHGVQSILAPGDRMLIALPVERDGGVGQQLAKGISRAGIKPILHGLPTNMDEFLRDCENLQPTCMIGFPVQMLAAAQHPLATRALTSLRSIILCSDSVSPALLHALHSATAAEVFEHYGSTEMGLGGGIDCCAHQGYHLREADLYFEVVSTQTGEPLPDGEVGELVFTTLHREAMPLIRYRTGDLSRFVPEPCPCGSKLLRLERIHNRLRGFIEIGKGATLTLPMLDNALFRLRGLRDFRSCLHRGTPDRLDVLLDAPGQDANFLRQAERALCTLPAIASSRTAGTLELRISTASAPLPVSDAKRRIEVC